MGLLWCITNKLCLTVRIKVCIGETWAIDCKKGSLMAIIPLLLLLLSSTLSAYVQPVEGQNLWRLFSGIASTVDTIESEMDIVLSQSDLVVSEVDNLVNDFASVADYLTSQIDAIDTNLVSTGDALSNQLSTVEQILLSVQDLLVSDVEYLQSQLSIIESVIEHVDMDITSAQETILDEISQVEMLMVSSLEQLETCLVGTPLTQADFVSGSFTISTPGVYTLCENITSSSTPVITIAANNVLLDFNGYTLTASAHNAVGVQIVGQSNVSVVNGSFVGNTDGSGEAVSVSAGAQNILIQDISSVNGGIVVNAGIAITVRRYHGMNNGSFVVFDNGSRSIIVEDSSVTGLTIGVGFSVFSSSDVLFNRCVSQSNIFGFAVNSTPGSSNVVLRDCYASNSSMYGFYCYVPYPATGPIMERCIADASGLGGFFVAPNSIGGEWIECSASNSGIGFNVYGLSPVLKRCVATNNTTGIMVQSLASSVDIFDTCPVNNTTNYVNDGTDTVFINLETVEDVLLSELESIALCACSAFENIISVLDSTAQQVASITDSFGSALEVIDECLIDTSISNSNLPLTISVSGVYTVCEPLNYTGTPATTPAITIAANNVVLDLNGYTLTTTNSQGVVCHGQTNVLIRNGTIQVGTVSPSAVTNQVAILVDTASQSVSLRDLTLYQPSDVGIMINGCSGVTIERCICEGYNGGTTGNATPAAIYITGSSSGALVKDCVVTSLDTAAPQRGIAVLGSSAATSVEIQSCSVHNTASGNEAFRIASSSTSLANVFLSNCLASESGGFLAVQTGASGPGPVFDHCVAEGGSTGFVVSNTSATMLFNCVASNNSGIGFSFDALTTQTVALLCSSQGGSVAGFSIAGAMTTLRWCTALNNAGNGFTVVSGATNTVIDGALAGQNTVGINDSGLLTDILDSRSQSAATTMYTFNSAYDLNVAPDVPGTATITRTS
jgi:hypothetical protein